MRGPVHPAGVEEHITRGRIASETGRSRVWPMARCPQGPHREGEELSPMMYGRGTSDKAIVAEKPANKAERSAAESVERRAEAKGNAGQQSMLWTQSQKQCDTGAGSMRTTASAMERPNPRWEPYAGKLHVRICAGGAGSNRRPYRDHSETHQRPFNVARPLLELNRSTIPRRRTPTPSRPGPSVPNRP